MQTIDRLPLDDDTVRERVIAVDEPLNDDSNASFGKRARDAVGWFSAVRDDSADWGHGQRQSVRGWMPSGGSGALS
jgi:hypothetical protein